jgi:hypothetical protein
MEVPDIRENLECCVSPFSPVSDLKGVYDAKMSIPGAATSGCVTENQTISLVIKC